MEDFKTPRKTIRPVKNRAHFLKKPTIRIDLKEGKTKIRISSSVTKTLQKIKSDYWTTRFDLYFENGSVKWREFNSGEKTYFLTRYAKQLLAYENITEDGIYVVSLVKFDKDLRKIDYEVVHLVEAKLSRQDDPCLTVTRNITQRNKRIHRMYLNKSASSQVGPGKVRVLSMVGALEYVILEKCEECRGSEINTEGTTWLNGTLPRQILQYFNTDIKRYYPVKDVPEELENLVQLNENKLFIFKS